MIRLIKTTGIFLMVSGSLLLLAACSATASVEQPPVSLSTLVDEAPTIEPTPDAPQPVEVALPDPAPTDECLACHLDKQRLIDTAAPLVVVASESEGEG